MPRATAKYWDSIKAELRNPNQDEWSNRKWPTNISIVYINHHCLKKWPTNISFVYIDHYCLKKWAKYVSIGYIGHYCIKNLTRKYIYCISITIVSKMTKNKIYHIYIDQFLLAQKWPKSMSVDHYCLKMTKIYVDCIYWLLLSQKWTKKYIYCIYIDYFCLKEWPTNISILITTVSKDDQNICWLYILITTVSKIYRKVYILYISITIFSKVTNKYIYIDY